MDDRSEKASPWPIFVAMGLATAELGILFGIVPLAVGGVLVFGRSVAGVITEAGYAEGPWRPLRLTGAVVGGAGALVWGFRSDAVAPDALLAAATTDQLAVRGAVVVAAGALLIAAGYAAPALARR